MSRAVARGIVEFNRVNLREFGIGRHLITDDYPFGGGPGMVLKPEPLFAAVESLDLGTGVPVVLMSPRGATLTQERAASLARLERLVLIAGHYEGVDQRVIDEVVTAELSIGDYVLSSGELPVMVVCDAVVRLLPGALTDGSTHEESFSAGLLEYPQYTRPQTFRGLDVPPILLSGHHAEVEKWRRARAAEITAVRRPDLLPDAPNTREAEPK